MAQVKPLKLLANGEISYIDTVNDELTMKTLSAETVTAEVVNIVSTEVGEKISLKAVAGDDVLVNIRDVNDVSVASIDANGNMIVQDLTVNGVETVVGNIVAQSELTIEGAFTAEGNVTLGDSSADLINFVGTVDTALNMGGNVISSLGAPVASGDAVNKAYVDDAIDNAVGDIDFSDYLKHDGTVAITGDLLPDTASTRRLGSNALPFERVVAENLRGVSAVWHSDATRAIRIDNRTLTNASEAPVLDWSGAELNFLNKRLTSIAAPTASGDAATKAYVDDSIDAAVGDIDFSTYAVKSELASTASGFGAELIGFRNTNAPGFDLVAVNVNEAINELALGFGTDLDDHEGRISAIEADYATSGFVTDQITALNISQYATDTDLTDGLALKLNLAGGVLTGDLTLANAPTQDLHAATKKYVDDTLDTGLSSKLDVSGGTMLGEIDMGGFKISALAAPSASGDAVNKAYVDDAISNVEVDLTGYATETYVDNAITALNISQYATETYVDDAITALNISQYATDTDLTNGLALKLDLAGGTLTGALTLAANPVNNLHAATKQYVDALVASVTQSEDVALTFTASGAITQGSPVFVVGTADDTIALADASSLGTSRVIGIAENAISNSASGKVTITGFATIPSGVIDGGAFVVGSPVYLSETTGNLTSTPPSSPGSRIYQVGIATAATKMVIDLKQGITVA